jgi:cytochrome P450
MFDPYDPGFLEDPYPTYAELRSRSPVFYDPSWELTFFASHGDISAILKDRERFGRDFRHRLAPEEVNQDLLRRIYPSQWPTWTRYIRESFIDLEPPRHTRLRRLVSQAFTRRSSEAFRPRLETAADRILDRALEEGSVDIIEDYATPIPIAMIAELMGIPAEDHHQLLGWSHSIVKVFDRNVTAEEGDEADRATSEFVSYLSGLVADRRRRPGEDLISSMVQVEEEGDTLTDEEIIATSILTLNAGHEATVHAIGNGVLALAGDPAQYRRLRDGEVGVASAVDELLRFDSPLQMFERWVLTDTEIGPTALRAGSKVGLLYGSANRDQEVFGPGADRLDLGRAPNPHLSFGAGLHHCVGAPLARVELEAAFGRLSARVTQLELREASNRIRSLVFRGVEQLRVELRAA